MPKVKIFFAIVLAMCLNTQYVNCVNASLPSKNLTLAKNLYQLRNTLSEMLSPYVKITISEAPPVCVKIECQYVCFNGKLHELARDINEVNKKSHELVCPTLVELRLYNYDFPNRTIPVGFLGEYSDKVQALYIATSNVSEVEGGAFANGVFERIFFEDLQLDNLRQSFFDGISKYFQHLSIIQKMKPMSTICEHFLDNVKYQIKRLTLQVGIQCIMNMTASGNLLNNLAIADFSYNNFEDRFISDTFSKMSMVEHLVLSHSHISYLPEYIFADFTSTLAYLDLSYNNLITISKTIFSWRELPRDLKIVANDNPWECSCLLFIEMQAIFKYQAATMFCETPEEYHDWSVFDSRLCPNDIQTQSTVTAANSTSTTRTAILTSDYDSPGHNELTKTPSGGGGGGFTLFPFKTTTVVTTKTTDKTEHDYQIQLQCQLPSNENAKSSSSQTVQRPTMDFVIEMEKNFRANVFIESEGLNDSFGLLWFSKVSTDFYVMEVNYNEFGMGCYGPISHRTIVKNLVPNMAYTFCLILNTQLTVSPFNCKSVHVNGNLGVTYSAWLTHDMRITGISLVVFGIVMFVFVGVFIVFMILKQKPILLKGSKRVATTKNSSGDIVVFPKDKSMEDFKLKEEMLAKRYSRSTISSTIRRNSTESIDSNQSYMNANLYEVIPAYCKINNENQLSPQHLITEQHDSYMSPLYLGDSSSITNLVCYATIPARKKRISDDPLPELPQNQPPFSLKPSESSADYAVTY